MKPETVGTLIVFAVLAIALWRVRSDFTEPEPETPRPERAEHIDLDGAWKPIGPIWPWEDTRKGDSRGHS